MSTVKDILLKVKALFDAPPAAPAAPAAPVGKPFKLKDGSEISIVLADPAGINPAVGDAVTISGAPAPAADYELEDGSKITVDATGLISVVTPVQPVTQTPEEMAAAAAAAKAAAAQPVVLTAEAVEAMFAKFATGTPEERIANLEVMCKALMEYNFGYEIRKGQDAAAIQAYKDSLATLQPVVTAQAAKMEAQDAVIAKYDATIKGLFELCEKLVELPTADPATLNGNKKEKFEKQTKREKLIEGFADAMKKIKEEKDK